MVERCTEAAVGDLADVPSQGPRESPLQTHGVGGGVRQSWSQNHNQGWRDRGRGGGGGARRWGRGLQGHHPYSSQRRPGNVAENYHQDV